MWINHREILSKVAIAKVVAEDVVVLAVIVAAVAVVTASKASALREILRKTAIAVTRPVLATVTVMVVLSQRTRFSSNTTIFSNNI